MPPDSPSCPLSRSQVLDLYFLEHRARLLDVAAFMDRFDRAARDVEDDEFRMRAIRDAIGILADGRPDRARRILELMSDPTEDPIPSAAGMKGAAGAYPGPGGG